MALHFANCQRRLQHDLIRYSCQSQEHYGKIAKSIVRNRTNGKLGTTERRWKRKRGGAKGELELTMGDKITEGYVMQAVKQMAHRHEIDQKVVVKPSAYGLNKRLKTKERADAMAVEGATPAPFLVKKGDWDVHTVVASENFAKYDGL